MWCERVLERGVQRDGFIPDDLYRRIVAAMPIVCVDLMVIDGHGPHAVAETTR
jgi:hypothetical protein